MVNRIQDQLQDIKLKEEVIDPSQLIQQVIDNLKPYAEKHRITLATELQDQVKLSCDPVQTREILTNLCINAIEAMKNGGTLTAQMFLSKKHPVIAVADTGVGIAKENLQKLLSPAEKDILQLIHAGQTRLVLIIGNLIKTLGVLILLIIDHSSIALLMLCYFTVGVGAVVYSPAKYGILPELTRNEEELFQANTRIEAYTIIVILTGIGQDDCRAKLHRKCSDACRFGDLLSDRLYRGIHLRSHRRARAALLAFPVLSAGAKEKAEANAAELVNEKKSFH